MQLVGFYRETECSPGRHRSNDALLLEGVASALRAMGFGITLAPLETTHAEPPDVPLIFSMCQGHAALDTLIAWERAGARILNSPHAARGTYRDRLSSIMREAGIPFPETRLVQTQAVPDLTAALNGGVWLKRGDLHASVSADVQWIDSEAALAAGFEGFAARGIETAAIQAHCAGREIKFYGVDGGRFFRWFATDRSPMPPFDEAALERLGASAAAAVGLDVYGGDVIVGPGGALTLIDLNDWPSFALCRESAAEAIAQTLMRRVHGA